MSAAVRGRASSKGLHAAGSSERQRLGGRNSVSASASGRAALAVAGSGWARRSSLRGASPAGSSSAPWQTSHSVQGCAASAGCSAAWRRRHGRAPGPVPTRPAGASSGWPSRAAAAARAAATARATRSGATRNSPRQHSAAGGCIAAAGSEAAGSGCGFPTMPRIRIPPPHRGCRDDPADTLQRAPARPHLAARQGRDPVAGAALHPPLPRQDHRHQVRRQRHDRPGAAAGLCRGRGAAQAGGHEPGGGARRRPADRGRAGQDRQEGHLHPGHARHRRGDDGSRRMGAGRPGAAGHRRPDQRGRRQGGGPDRPRRRADPRAQAAHARPEGPEHRARRRPGRRDRVDRPERGAGAAGRPVHPGHQPAGLRRATTRTTTSTPTWWPASWPRC